MKRKLAGILSDGFFHRVKILFFDARRGDPDDEGNTEMIPQVLRNREACRGNDQADIRLCAAADCVEAARIIVARV